MKNPSEALAVLESTAAMVQGGGASSIVVVRISEYSPLESGFAFLDEKDALLMLGKLSELRAMIETDLINKARTRKYIDDLVRALKATPVEDASGQRQHILAELEEYRAAGFAIPE